MACCELGSAILAEGLLGPDVPEREVEVRHIAGEAEGVPFVIEELSRHSTARAAAGGRLHGSQRVEFVQVIRSRLESLAVDARSLLELVAAAGRPLENVLTWNAAGLQAESLSVLAGLAADKLVKSNGRGAKDLVECYHDRISRALVELMGPGRYEECHRTLANQMEMAAEPDHERLFVHLREANEGGRARKHGLAATEKASKACGCQAPSIK